MYTFGVTMNNSKLKIALFMCVSFMFFIGASLFFSISLSNNYLDQLSMLNTSGQKQNETSDSFVYVPDNEITVDTSNDYAGDVLASFVYQNIDFVSYSEHWNETKLEELAHELFNNAHGEEIAYVARVELHDDNYDEYAGLHRSSYEKFSLPISVNRLLPSDMTLDFSTLSSVILLTGANENTTVASMARTMSHEYGHHFTQYYFGFRGTASDMNTKYASIRDESNMPIYSVITDWSFYIQNHMWDIQEIAAEDYVFLMGSDLARNYIDFKDNSELSQLYSYGESQYLEYMDQPMLSANAYPHENPVLASPSQIDGLAEYYYSFVDDVAPEFTSVSSDYGTMDLSISQTAADSYAVSWECPWQYPIISYTLVAYDANDYILKPIKTINGDEEAIAYFGIQTTVRNQSEYIIDDILDTFEIVRFRVVVTFSDGSVVFSDPYEVQF